MNILSIKGGGVRGIIPLIILKEIEYITGKPIYQLFDNFGGSSIGSLIVTGLLISDNGEHAKYTAQQMYDLFLNNVSNCFSWTYYSYITSLFGLVSASYTNYGLMNVTNEFCGNYTTSHLLKPFIFPTYDKKLNKNYYFTSKDNILLTDIIMSTTAAPSYYPAHKVHMNDREYNFVDSGLVSTSCTKLVLLDTLSKYQVEKDNIVMLNLGTGIFDLPETNSDGLAAWAGSIVNTMMNASYENEMYELSLMLPSSNYYNMDVPLDMKYFQMDNSSQDAITYYVTETNKWLQSNYDTLTTLCDRLLLNKGILLT